MVLPGGRVRFTVPAVRLTVVLVIAVPLSAVFLVVAFVVVRMLPVAGVSVAVLPGAAGVVLVLFMIMPGVVVVVGAVRFGEESLRMIAESGPAPRRAEQVGRTAVAHPVRAVRRHGHAANRVDVRHGQMLVRASTAISSLTTRGNSSPSSRAASATQWSR